VNHSIGGLFLRRFLNARTRGRISRKKNSGVTHRIRRAEDNVPRRFCFFDVAVDKNPPLVYIFTEIPLQARKRVRAKEEGRAKAKVQPGALIGL
jgi:hypothetical protein